MKLIIVQDLMVPLSGYATVSQDATLADAIKALMQAHEEFDQTRDRHRAILISDENNKIVKVIPGNDFCFIIDGN